MPFFVEKSSKFRVENAAPPTNNRLDLPRTPANNRSRVSNGRRLFLDVDGRSAWGRRYRDLIEGHVIDFGGVGQLSEMQKSLLRRSAAIEVELEQMEGQLAVGHSVDIDIFARVAGQLRRMFETLGLDRKVKDITPTLNDYLEARARQDRGPVTTGDQLE